MRRTLSGPSVWHDWPVAAPQYCPSPRELDDLELLLSGALAPLRTFQDPIGLDLPPELAEAGEVELVDPEGLPLARLTASGLEQLASPVHGPFRWLQLTPAQSRSRYAEALTVPVAAPLTEHDIEEIRVAAHEGDVLLLALTGAGTPQGVTPVGLVRTTLAGADLLARHGIEANVVVCPLASHGDPDLDHELGLLVAANYATTKVTAVTGQGELPREIAEIVREDQPSDDEIGFVVFFTGLSGSGKSTLARALHDLIVEDGRRTVTSLDGDVVRRNLSAGLSFSREDRETNIRRIGWVAAEIARHRGIAICSPIAPFAETREEVRSMVEQAGGAFVLVHVATPLEECERRDRKGLYARARAGEIPDFTGISSPYEEPDDAAIRIDTTGRTVADCLADLMPVLAFHRDAS